MQRYPLWKSVVLLLAVLLGGLYAAPNLFGEDPAVQINTASGDPLPAGFGAEVDKALGTTQLTPKSSKLEDKQWEVRFGDTDTQFKAADTLKRELGNSYVVALNQASRTPSLLKALGAKPMALGLDLRGGVHFLLQVDLDDAKKASMQRYLND